MSDHDTPVKHEAAARHGRSLLLPAFLSLNALAWGGAVALLIVHRMLGTQRDIYIAAESMSAAVAILNFMDNLLPVYMLCGSLLVLLLLVTAVAWVWHNTRSRPLRYGVLLLLLLGAILLVALWFGGTGSAPLVPPSTPTPAAAARA